MTLCKKQMTTDDWKGFSSCLESKRQTGGEGAGGQRQVQGKGRVCPAEGEHHEQRVLDRRDGKAEEGPLGGGSSPRAEIQLVGRGPWGAMDVV